ncbi:MAG: GNAT family N-acetyltransferase [Caldilineaceae bacterium]
MAIIIRPAQLEDVEEITELVNRFAQQNLMLPRKIDTVRQTLGDWLVALEYEPGMEILPVVGCGALVPLTDTLVELRSLAVDGSQHGKGVGSQLVLELVNLAKERGYRQICALTLRENFFVRLGFDLVDRWSISPKVWQACIYCPKFHRCDEVAVLMNLVEQPATVEPESAKPAAWKHLLKWEEWQPLRLAYKREPNHN